MKSSRFNRSTSHKLWLAALLVAACLGAACNRAGSSEPANTRPPQATAKIGVLLISHGSHSESWRNMVLDIEDAVRDKVVKDGRIAGIRSAFMEYNEPSIATRLKEFDQEHYTDVILVPLLLTVSSHSFDDIPTIAGQKHDHATSENLRLEGIEVYRPRARVKTAPLLDFPEILGKNVTRRVKQMSTAPEHEGIVLVAYGSEPYEAEWTELLQKVSAEVKQATGVDCAEHAWCGHIVRYQSKPTEKAIQKVLEQKERALVVPVLVAVDENFQGKIIGGAIENVDQDKRIIYRHDAVLPDENIHRWVVEISHKLASELSDANTP
jgi:sirohydrochlorin ferrochelatase